MGHYFLKIEKIDFTRCTFVTNIFLCFQSFTSLVLTKTLQDYVRS